MTRHSFLVTAMFRVYSSIQQRHTAYLLDLLFGFGIDSKYGRKGCGFVPFFYFFKKNSVEEKIAWHFI